MFAHASCAVSVSARPEAGGKRRRRQRQRRRRRLSAKMAAVLQQVLERAELAKLPKLVQGKLERFLADQQSEIDGLRASHERFRVDSGERRAQGARGSGPRGEGAWFVEAGSGHCPPEAFTAAPSLLAGRPRRDCGREGAGGRLGAGRQRALSGAATPSLAPLSSFQWHCLVSAPLGCQHNNPGHPQ